MSEAAADCIFCKIVSGAIPGTIVHRDEAITAFRDINPVAPTHILVVPNRHIPEIAAASEDDAALIGRLVLVANALARREGIAPTGYRLIINNGRDAGQEVAHVHVHLIGGRPLGRMVARPG